MMRRCSAALVLCMVGSAAAAPVVTPVRQTIVGAKLSVVFDSSPVANLVYQLDCMTVDERCTRAPYLALWKTLGWSSDDERMLARWRTMRERYVGGGGGERDPRNEALGFPFFGNNIEPDKKVRLAAYTADDLTQYRRQLGLVVTPVEADELVTVAKFFWPRSSTWWSATGRAAIARFVDHAVQLVDKHRLVALLEQFVSFYRVTLAPDSAVAFHLFVLPAGSKFSHAEQIEDCAIAEIPSPVKETDPIDEDDVSVVFHELTHFFFGRSDELPFGVFVKSSQPNALAAFDLLNEGLSTALQAVVRRRVLSPALFEKRLATPLGLYGEAAVDDVARAILPLVEKTLRDQGVFDEAFARDYLAVTDTQLAGALGTPRALLRSLSVAYDDDAGLAAARHLIQAVASSSSFLTLLAAPDATEIFDQYPEQSGALLVTTAHAARLRRWSSVLGKSVAAITGAARAHRAIVYGVAKSPRASIFVIVGRDRAALEQAVDALVALPRGRAGLLAQLD